MRAGVQRRPSDGRWAARVGATVGRRAVQAAASHGGCGREQDGARRGFALAPWPRVGRGREGGEGGRERDEFPAGFRPDLRARAAGVREGSGRVRAGVPGLPHLSCVAVDASCCLAPGSLGPPSNLYWASPPSRCAVASACDSTGPPRRWHHSAACPPAPSGPETLGETRQRAAAGLRIRAHRTLIVERKSLQNPSKDRGDAGRRGKASYAAPGGVAAASEAARPWRPPDLSSGARGLGALRARRS